MTDDSGLTREQRDLPGYTGPKLNELAWQVYDVLMLLGFRIAATTQSPSPGSALTLRITYRGVYVGLMRHDLWGRKKDPRTIVYRFPGASSAATPSDFVLDTFAKTHGIDPADLFSRYEPGERKHYLWVTGIETTKKLMQDWARYIDGDVLSQTEVGSDVTAASDIERIQASKESPERKRMLVEARMGQGKYRDDLLKEFGSSCVVTRLSVVGVLRASHIVPYAKSELHEQTDPQNGLLLAANVDALFDRYLITFAPDGTLRCSFTLLKHDLAGLGPMGDLLTPPCGARAAYLQRHNAEFDEREAKRTDLISRA
ncbi:MULTISPECIES: HNH endonuclease signature motif containing protein [unclassified Paraburkholderia]|uniref:HNH endonuclease n=1 Tax=unclassified Paraburkholderia TaxID=2615204 RepID=UPI002AB74ED3|nr:MULTISPECIES: HNH endonuclease signature motif containing protein [unclassified Paraburkholderia]